MMPPRTTGRPEMPNGYGISAGGDYLVWQQVRKRLVAAIHYWMATTRPDGRPHAVPRWGVWIDDKLWYDGSPVTRHARNLETNPETVLHLESGSEATIVEGMAIPSKPLDNTDGERISAEFRRKYADLGYSPGPTAWSGDDAGGLLVFTPRMALAWTDFPRDATRFSFEG